MVSSLEQQKRLKLDELKSQAQKLDKQVVKLKRMISIRILLVPVTAVIDDFLH